MSEIVILPEMLAAGVEALQECQEAQRGDEETVIAIYLAMGAILEISFMRDDSGRMH